MIKDRIEKLEKTNILANAISDDNFGNKRIAVFNNLTHSARLKVVKVVWDIYTVDANGDDVIGKNLLNPYQAHQAATDGVRVSPMNGERFVFISTDYATKTRAELEQELTNRGITYSTTATDAEIILFLQQSDIDTHISNTVSQYSFFTSLIKAKQSHYFDLLEANLLSDDLKGKI